MRRLIGNLLGILLVWGVINLVVFLVSGGRFYAMPSLLLLLLGGGVAARKGPVDWNEHGRPPHDDPDAETKHTKPVVSDW